MHGADTFNSISQFAAFDSYVFAIGGTNLAIGGVALFVLWAAFLMWLTMRMEEKHGRVRSRIK